VAPKVGRHDVADRAATIALNRPERLDKGEARLWIRAEGRGPGRI